MFKTKFRQETENALRGFWVKKNKDGKEEEIHINGLIEQQHNMFEMLKGLNEAILALARMAKYSAADFDRESNNKLKNEEYINLLMEATKFRENKNKTYAKSDNQAR